MKTNKEIVLDYIKQVQAESDSGFHISSEDCLHMILEFQKKAYVKGFDDGVESREYSDYDLNHHADKANGCKHFNP